MHNNIVPEDDPLTQGEQIGCLIVCLLLVVGVPTVLWVWLGWEVTAAALLLTFCAAATAYSLEWITKQVIGK